MYTFLEWVIQRATLDPDAFSCAIIAALLMLAMVMTAVVYFPGVAVYNLLRQRRKKGGRHVVGGQAGRTGEDSGRGKAA